MRLLEAADLPLLRVTLCQDPYYNLFMIGDLLTMGIDHEGLYYWGQFRGDDLVGVAMRYRRNWHFYDAGGADLSSFAGAIDAYPEDSTINGRASLVSEIVDRLTACEVMSDHRSHYCALPRHITLPAPRFPTRRATLADVDALVAHYATAAEMRRGADAIRFCIEYNRIYLTEVGARIVSAALTNVETEDLAMIGGVFTPKPLRSKGYASAAMTALCMSLLADGRQPCLFYDNPAAGVIYRRLGFADIGPWRLAFLRHHSTSRLPGL
jgi:predicted GNAT family acetyltransferase